MTYEEWLKANGRDGTDPQDKIDYQAYQQSLQKPDPAAEHMKQYGITQDDVNHPVYGKQLKKYYDDKAYLKDADGARIKQLLTRMQTQKAQLAAHDKVMEDKGIVPPRNNTTGKTPETWEESRIEETNAKEEIEEINKKLDEAIANKDSKSFWEILNGSKLSDDQRKKLGETYKEKLKNAGLDTKEDEAKLGNSDAGKDPGNTRAIEKKAQQDPKYRKATKSIIEAWRDGTFGDPDSEEAKATRNYFMANAIGTFARNLGRDIGNVGAQYTGGTIDSNRDVADWDQRKDELLANEITEENEEIVNSPAYRKAVSEAQKLDANELSNRIQAITAQYKEDDVRNYLVQQLQQIGMNDIAAKIANRKMALSDTFVELAADPNTSGLGSTIYGLLSVMSLPGNFSQAANAVGDVAKTML